MNTITGLPAHPLMVHIPVAMLPLAAFGVLILLVRQTWYERYRWAVLFVGAIGTLGAILAAGSGEALQENIRARDGIEAARALNDHVEAGDLAQVLAIVFFAALVGFIAIPWFLERKRGSEDAFGRIEARLPSWTPMVLKVLAGVTAIASTVSIINAGHSGASDVWSDSGTAAVVSD